MFLLFVEGDRGACRFFQVSLEMERRFLVETKSFVLSVSDSTSVLRVEEKRKGFSGVVLLGKLYTALLGDNDGGSIGVP